MDKYIDKIEDLNGVNNSIRKKIFKKNLCNNKSQIYLNRRKQLSYHLNINNDKKGDEEKEEKNKYIDEIFMSKVSNTINIPDKENYNPNRISIKNQKNRNATDLDRICTVNKHNNGIFYMCKREILEI